MRILPILLLISVLMSSCGNDDDTPETLTDFTAGREVVFLPQDSLVLFVDADSSRIRRDQPGIHLHLFTNPNYDAHYFFEGEQDNISQENLGSFNTLLDDSESESFGYYPRLATNSTSPFFVAAFRKGGTVYVSQTVTNRFAEFSCRIKPILDIDDEDRRNPTFRWTHAFNPDLRYVHVLANTDDQLISGVENHSDRFTFYDFDRVYREIRPVYSSPELIPDQQYRFALWAVDSGGYVVEKANFKY